MDYVKKYKKITIIMISLIVIGIILIIIVPGSKKEIKTLEELITKNEYTSKPRVTSIIRTINELPVKVTKSLIKNDITITFINQAERNEGNESTNSYAGDFKYQQHAVREVYQDYTLDREIMLKYAFETETFHEIGHAFDCKYGIISKTNQYSSAGEFKEIFNREARVLFNNKTMFYMKKTFLDYHLTKIHEYFAETFGLYFANEDTNKLLQQYAPETYNYIKSITS